MQEQAARVAVGVVDSLKTQPLCLSLVLLNLGLLGFLYYDGVSHDKERAGERDLLYKNRHEVAVLLARCNWPEGQPLPKDFNENAK